MELQSNPLQEYIDKACNTMNPHLHNEEVSWYEEGANSFQLLLQEDQDHEIVLQYMSIPVEIKVVHHQLGGNIPFVGIYTQGLFQGSLITKDDGRHIPWEEAVDSKNNIILLGNSYFRIPFQLEWREIISRYPTELMFPRRAILAKGIAQQEPLHIWDGKLPNKQWELCGSRHHMAKLEMESRVHLMQP